MCLAQDNKRKAGTAAGFGSEMHGKPGCREGLNEQQWETYMYIRISEDAQNITLRKE